MEKQDDSVCRATRIHVLVNDDADVCEPCMIMTMVVVLDTSCSVVGGDCQGVDVSHITAVC